jgi:hypothetical protein
MVHEKVKNIFIQGAHGQLHSILADIEAQADNEGSG